MSSAATPAAERVVGGLWSIPVPIPDNPLGHTLVYAFETVRGPVLVDSGWDDDTSWERLCAGLTASGHSVSEVYGVLVTHVHNDHHGLSARVREASGAWIAMHPADSRMLTKTAPTAEAARQFSDELGALLLDAGASEDELRALRAAEVAGRARGSGAASGARARAPLAVPDRELTDGAPADVPGWRVDAVWTPGHSPGHTCFRVPEHHLLLAGDHVLPTITPHIAISRGDRGGDPLGDFLASLAKVDRPDVHHVLPAHEHRFDRLSARVAEITAHHRVHLDTIELALAHGPRTLWELASIVTWNRPWAELGLWMRRAAVNETAAHLRHLTVLGRVERCRGVRPYTFRIADGAPRAAPTP